MSKRELKEALSKGRARLYVRTRLYIYAHTHSRIYRIQYILELYERKKGYRKLEKPNTEIQFDGVMHLMHKRIITIAFVYIIFNLFIFKYSTPTTMTLVV